MRSGEKGEGERSKREREGEGDRRVTKEIDELFFLNYRSSKTRLKKSQK